MTQITLYSETTPAGRLILRWGPRPTGYYSQAAESYEGPRWTVACATVQTDEGVTHPAVTPWRTAEGAADAARAHLASSAEHPWAPTGVTVRLGEARTVTVDLGDERSACVLAAAARRVADGRPVLLDPPAEERVIRVLRGLVTADDLLSRAVAELVTAWGVG